MKVLLADDHDLVRDTLAAYLMREPGIEVATAADLPAVAKRIKSEGQFDLVLLDYNMPSLKGDDLCAILKRNVINPRMKIVIFSSEPEHDLVRIVNNCGADGYIKKNAPGHLLLQHISAAAQPACA